MEALTTTTTPTVPLTLIAQPESLFATVSLSTLPLVSPGLDRYVGVQNLASVVVLLLFVGSNCGACEEYYKTLFNFYHRVNSIVQQVEVIIVSGHKNSPELMRLVSRISNPFPAVAYNSEVRLALLRKFGLPDTTEYDSFEPKIHIMEWMGAYARGAEPTEAAVCHVVRDAFANIAALAMPALAKKPGMKAKGTSWLKSAVNEEIPEAHRASYDKLLSNDPAYAPLDKIQSIRERCNFIYAEMRDTLYQLRMHPYEQSTYIKSLGVIASRMTPSPHRQGSHVPQEKYLAAIRELTRLSLNTRILDLIGAPRSSEPGGEKASPRVNTDFLKHLLQRQYARLQPILEDPRRPTGLFPRLSLKAIPGAPVYHIKLYYRSRDWSAVREAFPRSTAELLELVGEKIKDVNIDVAKVFSDDLNPRSIFSGWENCLSRGITQTTGSLQYSSFEDIQPQLSALFRENEATGLVKIRIVVIDTQTRLNAVKPATDKAFVMSQIRAMQVQAEKENAVEFSFLRSLLSGAIVMKLIELDEYQEQVLRRIPVVSLHFQAVQDVLAFRTQYEFGTSTPPLGPTTAASMSGSDVVSTGSSPLSSIDEALFRRSLLGRSGSVGGSDSGGESGRETHMKTPKLAYQEALLKRLVQWFTTDFYDWLPDEIGCMRDVEPRCMGNMDVCLGGCEPNRPQDDNGRDITEPVLRNYLFDEYFCQSCGYQYRIYRPVHDVVKMVEYTQGRCGEHGKAFALAARSLGFDVRLIIGQFKEKKSDGSMFSFPQTDHLWNEVFIEADPNVVDDEGRWVHVDVSADDRIDVRTGGMGIPAELGYDHPEVYDSSVCAHKLLSAAAVGRGFVSWVLDKYVTSGESLKYAQTHNPPEFLLDDMAVLSGVIADFPVNPGHSSKNAFLHHLEHAEAAAIATLHAGDLTEPKYGRGQLFKGPANTVLEVIGGEIPEWAMRPKQTLFSSYDLLMRMDGRIKWRVCRVDVFKAQGIVTEVRFGYCSPIQTDPTRYSSSMDSFAIGVAGLEDEAAPRAPDRRFVVPKGDTVGFIHVEFNADGGQNRLTNVEVQLQSEMGVQPGMGTPFMGFYGARASDHKPGIEFIGFYVINREAEL